jgi:hypothetical protein
MKPDIEFIRTLRKNAEAYYNLGFNVTGLKNNEKAPYHKWADYQHRRQTEDQAFFHEWHSLTGIGVISGISGLFCLDFDHCDQSHIPTFLEMLGLPIDYNWIVISGSGKGFHIWFSSNQLRDRIGNIGKVVKFYLPKTEGMFKQLELRINCHVVMPPSRSASGGEYKFLYPNDLSVRPNEIAYEIDPAIS